MEPETEAPKVKPEEESSGFQQYPLIAAFDPQLKFNILKFAPSSNRRVDLSTFVQPVKLNRKDPWAIRKKAEEEKKKLLESKTQDENPIEDDKVGLQDEIRLNSSEQQKPNPASKSIMDDSIVAPSPASQSKLKTQPFQKKTKQVYIASDQAARMLKKEEYQSWLLEDGSSNGERWIGRYESAGAATSTSDSTSNNPSTMSNNDASNYVLFRLDGNGPEFEVIPCHRFYRFTQRPNYDTLGADEAEAAYEKMQKPTTKEDVGRWFMRRRGVNSTTDKNQEIKNEENPKSSSSTGFFDHSKINLGTENQIKNQVEIPNFINGRRNKFTAVHGANQSSNFNDEDEDKKPSFGQEGDFDEVEYEAEFDDDEEGAGNLNDEAMEEDEVKELADKMKREMLAAGKAGDDERNKEKIDLGKDPLFGERADLTKEGKAVKKLLMRKGDDDVYGSDEDVRNPYASEQDESDLEEVVPQLIANVASPLDGNQSTSRSGTPGPGSQNNNPSIVGSRNINKVPGSQSTNLKNDKPLSRPPSRSGTPGLPGDGRMNPSNHSIGGVPGFTTSAVNRSRSTSPQILPSSKGTHSGTVSPVLPPFLKSSPSSPNHMIANGKRKQHPTGAIMTKDKKVNAGPGPGNYLLEQSLSSSTNIPNSNTCSNRTDQGNTNVISKQHIIELLRRKDRSTKELLSHFKVAIREENNRVDFGIWTKEVATLTNGLWVLKAGI